MIPSDKLPYIPNLNKVFDTYSLSLDEQYSKDWEENAYFRFLRDNALIIVKNNIILSAEEYDLSEESTRKEIFYNYLISREDVAAILNTIGDSEKSLAYIIDKNRDSISENDIRVLLSWLEYLNQIDVKSDDKSDNKYRIIDNADDDSEKQESIYPLSYHDTLDISEDKYSVFEYLRKIRSGKIKLNPNFQRGVVWKQVQKSRFIESAILQIPIPTFYMKRRPDGVLVIIDGLQRTYALSEFIDNKYALTGLEALSDLNGKTFKNLEEMDSTLSSKIEDKQLFFYILGSSVPMAAVYDIFNRINTGGTKLERQEVRNCVFIGHSTKFLKDIVQTDDFKKATDNGINDERMKAQEAVLRCVAFVLQPVDSYQGSIDEFLERAMKRLNSMSIIEIEDLEKKVLKTLRLTREFFGKNNFRIPKEKTRGKINVAVMEVVFNCFWNKDRKDFRDKQTMRESYLDMVADPGFLESFRISTSSKSGVNSRFSIAHRYLDGK